MSSPRPFCTRALSLIAAGWFLLALFIGETELLADAPPFTPQIVALGITAVLIGWYASSPALRLLVDAFPSRALIALHLFRFVGLYFLLGGEQLDARFAFFAGWGDIAVAVGALALLVLPAANRVVLLWNTVGLLDVLTVLGAVIGRHWTRPDTVDTFTRLPLSFLPMMLVPLAISTHVLIYLRSFGCSPERFSGELPSDAIAAEH